MEIKEIVYVTDFSSASKKAGEYAKTLASSSNIPLAVLHVFDNRVIAPGPYHSIPGASTAWMEKYIEENKVKGQELLDNLYQELGATGGKYFLDGKPSKAIVAFSEQNPNSILVLGSHGYTGLGKVFLGSVSEHVVKQAKSPVLTIKGDV